MVLSLFSPLKKIPAYAWTIAALISGILLGGTFPTEFEFISVATQWFIRLIVQVIPIFIFLALSPPVASLIKHGSAGKFGGSVILFFVLSSTLAGLLGVVISSLIFNIPLVSESSAGATDILSILGGIGEHGASLPLISIFLAIALGAVSVFIPPLQRLLSKISRVISGMGRGIGYVMAPLIFCFGITIGVRFGAMLGMNHYLSTVVFTFFLCLMWFLLAVFILVRLLAGRSVGEALRKYFIPTAMFGAGTCSSLVTLPVNLSRAKVYGVRDEVADFVIPFGAVINLNASALAYLAFGPFVMSHIFHYEVSWSLFLFAWPIVVLFTIAAPGLPAGMGTPLWAATLFASLVGLDDPTAATFITTYIALCGGVTDMFITIGNCTTDGFVAIFFDRHFDRYFTKSPKTRSPEPHLQTDEVE